MRTFYIFKINSEYFKLTRKIPFNLYSAYLNIKMSTKDNINYLYNQYFSFTVPFNKVALNKHIYNKMKDLDGYNVFNNIHTFNNYYTDEVSKLTIYNSFMTLKSNSLNSTFFKELYSIPCLFIVDFESQDYFFLNNLKSVVV